jgi:hypothetical protein
MRRRRRTIVYIDSNAYPTATPTNTLAGIQRRVWWSYAAYYRKWPRDLICSNPATLMGKTPFGTGIGWPERSDDVQRDLTCLYMDYLEARDNLRWTPDNQGDQTDLPCKVVNWRKTDLELAPCMGILWGWGTRMATVLAALRKTGIQHYKTPASVGWLHFVVEGLNKHTMNFRKSTTVIVFPLYKTREVEIALTTYFPWKDIGEGQPDYFE